MTDSPPSPKSPFPPHLRANTDPRRDHPVDAELSIRPRGFDFGHEFPPTARNMSEPLPDRTPRPLAKTDTTQQIADNVQSAIHLLSHLSPGLDADESVCGVHVPTTSLSALLSSMQSVGSLISNTRRLSNIDMDALVQRVGDMLSGEAAQKGVDLLIQHDLSLGIAYGDAEGVVLLFTHLVRQYLGAAQTGDNVTLGLVTKARPESNVLDCSFQVTSNRTISADFSNPTCEALLRAYSATVTNDTLSLSLPLGVVPSSPTTEETVRLSSRIIREPTLEELEKFPKTLRGRTALVHATLDSVFASHCKRILTSWGINLSEGAPRYILIDDNMAELQTHLASMPQARPPPPSRTISSPIIHTTAEPYIIYFTSIANFSRVRELASSTPNVVVIPKPVGPRRLLTALYTAASPLDPLSPLTASPDIPELDTSLSRLHIPTTELVTTPASEYFSSSSGPLIMQAPDGRPYGMYFEPLAPTTRKPSLTPRIPSDSARRRTIGRRTPSGPTPEADKPSSTESTPARRRTLPYPTIETTAPPGRERAATTSRVRKSPVSAKKPLTAKDAIVPPIKVLIVEDNPINQNILSMFLRKKQIKHEVAKTGLEAVEKWRTGGFHLILMDIQLPVMDGIEATKEIRKLEKTNNIGIFPTTPTGDLSRTADTTPSTPFRSSVIIVALTASSLQSDRVGALAAGCNDFLTKPVSLKWLDRKIVEWGCMQALIDFDGWRRSKGDQRGFTAEAQRAAKTLASRLRIERKKPVPPPEDPELSSISEDVEVPVVKVAS